MKTRFALAPLLLAGLLVALAPLADAQRTYRTPAYTSSRTVRPSYFGATSYGATRLWIPGRYETVWERVWIPGRTERVWIEPAFELRRDACGNYFRVLVSAGHWKTVEHCGHYETRSVRVWRPGHWEYRCS